LQNVNRSGSRQNRVGLGGGGVSAGKCALATKPTTLRKSITPGTVLILLAGRFRGRRVVFLKQLPSGLLLVTGPYKVNGVPLKRVNQAYVIATTTKVDVSGVKVPDTVTDKYFAREKTHAKKTEAGFFGEGAQKAGFKPDAKKADQKAVDAALVSAIKKNVDLKKYLGAKFSLTGSQKPHEMKF